MNHERGLHQIDRSCGTLYVHLAGAMRNCIMSKKLWMCDHRSCEWEPVRTMLILDLFMPRPHESCTTRTTHWQRCCHILSELPVLVTLDVQASHVVRMTHSQLMEICEHDARVMCLYTLLVRAQTLISFNRSCHAHIHVCTGHYADASAKMN